MLLPAAAAVAAFAAPALADPGYELFIASDDRFRGLSISDHRPVATFLVSYDDPNGIYAGASTTIVATEAQGVEPLRAVQYLGYVRRLTSGLAVDAGAVNRLYSRYVTGDYGSRLTEAYLGLVGRRFSSRLYFTPRYEHGGGSAIYAEVNGQPLQTGRWAITSHLGLLLPVDEQAANLFDKIDWQLGVARRFGRLTGSVQWTGPNGDDRSSRAKDGVVIGLRRSF